MFFTVHYVVAALLAVSGMSTCIFHVLLWKWRFLSIWNPFNLVCAWIEWLHQSHRYSVSMFWRWLFSRLDMHMWKPSNIISRVKSSANSYLYLGIRAQICSNFRESIKTAIQWNDSNLSFFYCFQNPPSSFQVIFDQHRWVKPISTTLLALRCLQLAMKRTPVLSLLYDVWCIFLV
jgi:hypothetical protein